VPTLDTGDKLRVICLGLQVDTEFGGVLDQHPLSIRQRRGNRTHSVTDRISGIDSFGISRKDCTAVSELATLAPAVTIVVYEWDVVFVDVHRPRQNVVSAGR